MVIRTRVRAVLIPLVLYGISGAAASFFVWSAANGERGSRAKAEYIQQIAQLEDELASLRKERQNWATRVKLMKPDAIDADLLEEEARYLLNRVDKRDLVIFTSQPR